MTRRHLYAATAAELPGGAEPPTEILLLPAGEVRTRPHDSRESWQNADPQAVVDATRALRLELPIDYEHQSLMAKDNGQPAPAAGWIREVFVRDGAIWGRVEWNERASAMIRSREYRFISPTFAYEKKTRQVMWITGAALVNDPALYMTAIAGRQTQQEESDMGLKALAKALGLAETATEAEVLAAAKAAHSAVGALVAIAKALGVDGATTGEALTTALSAQKTGITAIATAAGLAEDATLAAIAEKVKSAAAGSQPDPSAFVPRSEFDRVTARLDEIESTGATDRATAAVDQAVKDGKVAPASREWALGYAKKDPQGFADFVKGAPAILSNGRVVPANQRPEGGDTLTADEKAVCRAMGIKEEDYIASAKALTKDGGTAHG